MFDISPMLSQSFSTFATAKNAERIVPGSFAEACYDQNSISELQQALRGSPDKGDMKKWGLTESEWKKQIKIALDNKIADKK